jgi:hypothetical protein
VETLVRFFRENFCRNNKVSRNNIRHSSHFVSAVIFRGAATRITMANPGRKSHKGKARIPTLVVGGTSSQESFHSADERRTRTKIGVVEDTAGLAEEPTRWYQEDLATSVARGDPKFSYQLGYSVSCEPDNETGDGIEVVLGPVQAMRFPNAVRILSSRNSSLTRHQDRPLKAWYTHCDDYVYEQLRHEGRGSARVYARCSGVRCNDPGGECPNRRCGGTPEYRCANQACTGEAMYCASCIVVAHSQLPTHFIEVCSDRTGPELF